MKKNILLPDDAGASSSYDFGGGATIPAPATATDGLFVDDDGYSFPLATAEAGSITVSAGSSSPVATIATLANYLTTGFWQYNNTIAHHWASSTITYNINGLNTAEQFLAQSALQEWHEVANVTFVQTTGAANITFVDTGTMQAVTNASWYGNGAMAVANVDISSDWIANDGGARDGKTGIDSYGFQTYIHEIGHALGLGHQGPYNGSAVYSTNAVYADDTWQYSIMSYFSQNNFSGSTYRYVVSPQMADIYAVQQIYGADTTTRTGDTVYGFHGNAGSIFDFTAYTRAPALTIYDSGGSNTLDCSGYSVAQTIDLHAGAFSSVGGLVNNIGIALGTNINTAIAGSGNDTLIANDNGCTLIGGAGNDTLVGGAGNDRLVGGAGVDTMTGGGGADTFVFAFGDSSAASGQHDRITDFVSGTDHIDLSSIDAIAGTAGIDQFYFIGTAAFDGRTGELDYFYNSTLGVTVVQGDTNGDRVADFAIDLVGHQVLGVADFIGAYSAPVVIEAFGATTLTQQGGTYYLYSHGTTTGPTLKYNGAAVGAGQFGATWAPIGSEQVAGGYEVAWKASDADQYAIWNTDSNGNYSSNSYGILAGGSATLESLETSFHQDLNGDGQIGAVTTTIESFGSTSVVAAGNNYFLNGISNGSSLALKYGGTAVVASQFGANWAPIGAEQVGSGYEVAWKASDADQYAIWNTDSNGNYSSNSYGLLSGSSATLESQELTLHQDLNGDGQIGPATTTVATTVIEAFGSTSVVVSGNNYLLNTINSGSSLALKYGGTAVMAGQFGATWAPIGAEQVGSGYVVAWKASDADQYAIWNTDGNGNYSSNSYGLLSGSSVTLESQELTFHQDLNGDGQIGPPTTVIEAFGSTSVVAAGDNYLLNTGGASLTLKYAGIAVATGQFGATWKPIGAEQVAGGGYQVAWKASDTDQYAIWNTDSNGNYSSNNYGILSGGSASLQSLETSFHQDLNGDGVIGLTGAAHETVLASANEQVDPTPALADLHSHGWLL